jgi:hypothetical protein
MMKSMFTAETAENAEKERSLSFVLLCVPCALRGESPSSKE